MVNLGPSSQHQAWKSEVLAGQGEWERDWDGASPTVLCFPPFPLLPAKPRLEFAVIWSVPSAS